MVERASPISSLVVNAEAPLIGLTGQQGGRATVRYFVEEAEADTAIPEQNIEDALALAGAWSDLDWDEMAAALDRIRHESEPTPPIEI